MRVLVATLVLAAFMPSLANAQEHHLQALPGMDIVIVWKSADAQDEANQLINAGAAAKNPQILAPYVSCVVEPGAGVIVTDMGFVTHDIMVIDGPSAGCKGNIPAESLG